MRCAVRTGDRDTWCMWSYLLFAPTWMRSLVMGTTFGLLLGVGMTFLMPGAEGGWVSALINFVVSGVIFGVVMGQITKRQAAAARSDFANLSTKQRLVVVRSAARGPAVRRAALRQARRSRDLTERQWKLNTTTFAIAMVCYVVLALVASPWWWAAFALFTVLLATHLTSRARITRRIHLLSADGDGVHETTSA